MKTIVGTISFGGFNLDVYSSMDSPLFRATDVGEMIDYSKNNIWKLLELCEEDEKVNDIIFTGGQRRLVNFITEGGLYTVLLQTRKPIARKWRRIIRNELIRLRQSRNYDIRDQFDDWDNELNTIYIDPETGVMMQSVTVQGGDVIQIPYVEEEE